MAMLLGPANGSTMVRPVLDVTFQPMARQLYHFFPVVIYNLIKEPAKKHSDKPVKTIQHCNQWPDDCTFFFGCNLIKEPAKTIRAHGTPKHSNQLPDDCTFFSGRNLIDKGTRQKT
jgi:hypothetical protein